MRKIKLSDKSLTELAKRGTYSHGGYVYRLTGGDGAELYVQRRKRGRGYRYTQQLVSDIGLYQYRGLRQTVEKMGTIMYRVHGTAQGGHGWSNIQAIERIASGGPRAIREYEQQFAANKAIVEGLFNASTLTAHEIMENLEGAFGDEIERNIERIIYGFYDRFNEEEGLGGWQILVNKLAVALGRPRPYTPDVA